jgi:hypothetical protein
MIDPITAQMLVRAEHHRIIQSMRPVPEYAYNLVEHRNKKRRILMLRTRPILVAILHLLTK